jgi:hypothetical protein
VVTDNVGNSTTFETHFLEVKNKYNTHSLGSIKVFFVVMLLCLVGFFAQTARVKGVILDANNPPVDGVNIACASFSTIPIRDFI